MIVHKIVRNYLKDNGYSGLYYDDCGCEVDNLFPCDAPCALCKPGYKVMCTENCDHDGLFADGDWHIQPEYPNRNRRKND